MRKITLLVLFILLKLLLTQESLAQVSGFILIGSKAADVGQSSKMMVKGITVKAYDIADKLIISTVSDVNGHYKLDIPLAQHVRVEFSSIPESMVPVSGNSLVRFVTSPEDVSLALYNPSHFTGERPRAVQAVYATGSFLNKGIDSVSSLVIYHANPSDTIKYASMAKFKSTGAIWGLAYDRVRKRLFSSALAKRQSTLGSLGAGGIYVISPDQGDTQPFVSLDELGFSTAPSMLSRILSDEVGVASHDSLMFSQVGKIGLGGLDISDDGRFLYTINLFDRHLYRIKLDSDGKTPTAKDVTRYALPFEKYAGGDARPFAVKYYNGQVYIGVVCDAQTSQQAKDLQAYVYVINADEGEPGKTKFKEVAHFSLDYPRGVIDYNVKGWYPWTDNYLKTVVPFHTSWMIYPQPMLADIEFDTDGSLIVSLMDRLGHQTGNGDLYRPKSTGSFLTASGISGGDVLRLGKLKKTYETEQNGQIGARVSQGHNNGEGPGGGEFYTDDAFASSGITWHQETGAGGIALLPDANRLLVSVREPDQYTTGGVKWFSNETGAVTQALSVFPGGMKPGYFWKTNNVGDIELITELPPMEIGDRVWLDNDGDGTQGADEPALEGITLELYRDNQLVGQTKSDEKGRYSFNDKNVTETVKSRTDYEVRIALKRANAAYNLTGTKKGNSPELDNDALISGEGNASIAFSTANPGEHIHNLDVGFLCNDKPQTTASVICADNRLQAKLSGFKENEKYDLTPTAFYEGIALYNSATAIGQNGLVAEAPLLENTPYEATLRVYAPSGCYQDHFITSAGKAGCNFIPESQELKKAYTLSVYPNPSTGPFQFDYRGNTSDASVTVEITNMNGRLIKKNSSTLQNGYLKQTVNLSEQARGTYLLTVKEGTRQITKSIVKN